MLVLQIKSIYLSRPNIHKYKIIMTTYKKQLYGVTGSTQGADAPLERATHVLKTSKLSICLLYTSDAADE